MDYFKKGFEEECASSGVNPGELVKQAALSEDEFKKLRELMGMKTDSPGLYKEYLQERKAAKILASLGLAAKGGVVGFLRAGNGKGIPGALAGTGIGGLTGLALSSLGLRIADYFDRKKMKRLEKGEAPSLLTSILS